MPEFNRNAVGRGPCGTGMGRGRGRSGRRAAGQARFFRRSEKETLRYRAEFLKEQLDSVNSRIRELESN